MTHCLCVLITQGSLKVTKACLDYTEGSLTCRLHDFHSCCYFHLLHMCFIMYVVRCQLKEETICICILPRHDEVPTPQY